MKPFESLNHFVEHYKKKVTIPKNIEVIINENKHTLERYSIHNKQDIGFNQWDRYIFREDNFDNIDIRLKVNYYRYFDEKALFEAFFEFNHNDIRWISPIYFYDQFVNSKDNHFERVYYSKTLENWTGLKWIDTSRWESKSLDKYRLNAFEELKKELYYTVIHSSRDSINEIKWEIDEKGESPYFREIEYIPNSWKCEDD